MANFFGDWENDPENVSKVVNEDGTPIVLLNKDNSFDLFQIKKIESSFDDPDVKNDSHTTNDNNHHLYAYSQPDLDNKTLSLIEEYIKELPDVKANIQEAYDIESYKASEIFIPDLSGLEDEIADSLPMKTDLHR